LEGVSEDAGSVRAKVVIMCHNDGANSDRLAEKLSSSFYVSVFDSGSENGKAPAVRAERLPNLYWTGCWAEALRRYGGYDALWVVCGDVTLPGKAESYLEAMGTAMPFGCWSPAVDGNRLDLMSSLKAKGRLLETRRLEGMCLAVSRGGAAAIGGMPSCNKLGWGMDTWMCWMTRKAGYRNILDGRVLALHPAGCGYGKEEARREMETTMRKLVGSDWRRKTAHESDVFESIVVREVGNRR
jgi:hypothetical protein